jgi:cell division protein FtsA
MLSNDQRRDGCALVNIGADTTTISIYHNNRPRMLTVLPLGSNNITRDITNEHISPANAEEIKIIRGYKSTANNNEHIDSNTLDSIINARMGEILQNIKHQLETSGERVHYVVFTGGGSKLKNIGLLLEEYLPGYKTEIKPEPRLNLISESGANVDGVITTALYGLLKQGKENCCEVEEIVPVQPNGDNIFSQEEMSGTYNKEKESEKTETQPENKPQNHTKKHEETKGPKKKGLGLGTLFAKWLEDAMSDPDDEKTNNNNNQ